MQTALSAPLLRHFEKRAWTTFSTRHVFDSNCWIGA
jgi:hypothetical protein